MRRCIYSEYYYNALVRNDEAISYIIAIIYWYIKPAESLSGVSKLPAVTEQHEMYLVTTGVCYQLVTDMTPCGHC